MQSRNMNNLSKGAINSIRPIIEIRQNEVGQINRIES